MVFRAELIQEWPCGKVDGGSARHADSDRASRKAAAPEITVAAKLRPSSMSDKQ
jgi:hypothetical protein